MPSWCCAAGSWLPGTDIPSHLNGLAGNYGFDPLSLGTDKERLAWCASQPLHPPDRLPAQRDQRSMTLYWLLRSIVLVVLILDSGP